MYTGNDVSMNRKILHLALPAIISNITVPLLGLVDVAIVGHLGAAAYIGAIAVGGMLFNMIYWLFGFLRMGTSGLTSQAYGKRDFRESVRVLYRALGVGLAFACCLILLQEPVRWVAFRLMEMTPAVQQLASIYFHICVWGAPAVLGLYALSGWFIGMQNSRIPMWVAIAQNVVNIIVSLVLVYGCGLKVEGVALGTLIAQYAGLGLAACFAWRYYRRFGKGMSWQEVFRLDTLHRFLLVNRDIFLRTLCLVAVTVYFTSAGARQGEVVLAVNTLLMQLFTLFSYIMDGFAYAGEALAGRYIGAGRADTLRHFIRVLFRWGWGVAGLFTALYALGGEAFLSLLTDDVLVLRASDGYFYWVLLIPLAGFSAFLWDGIYIGATATRQMLYSMMVASVVFFVVYFSLHSRLGNHALWLAFILYLVLRGVVERLLSGVVYTMTTRSP